MTPSRDYLLSLRSVALRSVRRTVGFSRPPTAPPHILDNLPKIPALAPETARSLLVFSLLLDPLILARPLHPYLHQWSATALIVVFPLALSATHSSYLSSLARTFVRARLSVLSSRRALACILGLIAVCIVAEAALVLGRAAPPLLIVGAALGIPGAISIVRLFSSQFETIRQKLEETSSFESSVSRTTATFSTGALLCARLSGFFAAVSLLPVAGAPLAAAFGATCSLSLLIPPATERLPVESTTQPAAALPKTSKQGHG